MSELARAVALDPANSETVAMLADIMATPPGDVPAAVEAQFDREGLRIMRIGAAQSLVAMAMWILTLPFFLFVGFAHPWQAALIAVPVALTTALSFIIWRSGVSWAMHYVAVAILNCAALMVSRIYGPFLLVPTILAANAIVLQTHPRRRLRRFSVACGALTMLIGAAIEWFGWLPSSYIFEDGVWTIVPQMVKLPRVPTFAFLTIASIATVVVPASFIARLRDDLTDAQVRLGVQAWHFKRLGAPLIGQRV